MKKQATLRDIELAISRWKLIDEKYDPLLKGYIIAEGKFTLCYFDGEIGKIHRKKIKIIGQIKPVWGTSHLTKFTMTELSGIAGSKGKLIFIPGPGSRKKPLKEKYDLELKGHILNEGEFTSVPIHIENGVTYGETIEVVGQEVVGKKGLLFKITNLSMIDGRKGKLIFFADQDSKELLPEPIKQSEIKIIDLTRLKEFEEFEKVIRKIKKG